jgi:hypothetical protein
MRTHPGTVVEFDAERGRGVVEGAGGVRLEFHCTRVTDGSRSVPVGASVRYQVVPGALGRWEAAAIEVISAS